MTAPAVDTTAFAWRIEQGEREVLSFPILSADNDPFPIDGWTIDAKVKTRPGGAVLYVWPAEHISVAGHIVELLLPASVSTLWTWTSGWWRVVVTDPGTDVADPGSYRVIAGSFVVDPD